MAQLISGNRIRKNDGKVVSAVNGAWYDGRRFLDGQLLAPGEHQAGQRVSNEVIAQTNPDNVRFVQQQREQVRANEIQAPTQISLPNSSATTEAVRGLTAGADQAKTALQEAIKRQQSEVDTRLTGLREKEKETLDKVGTLVTPFREEIETVERDRLHINKNFEANQTLINELDTLLTEGNELIRQSQEVTGLAAVRNPRIQKAMDDVAARAGVIEAVINARNGQIAVAENMIDRTINAIASDRADQINYYETILNLNRQDIISLDNESKKLAEEQLNIKKTDLKRANDTADMLKELMLDPNKAQLVGQAGVKLTDSVEVVNQKLARAAYAVEVADLSNSMVSNGAEAVISPTGVPKGELQVLTDSRGKKHFFRVREENGKLSSKTGTASERSVNRLVDDISTQAINFPDVVVGYANQLTLSEIYSAYNQSEMGKKFGRPRESSNEVALLYKWARGEITENEYRAALGG